ncbi:hypothetical protein K493DRAFT_300936 [Basidiobolus meristosporus CBS 931.73]|uniref:Yeast cell wall synthesis Kre9/Knh1-like N-terminal domain-containing protein n=1 Tax=Basidiobolus meristosporus CBS 931.73 TaxID=1314790 RepID=A0A1Y1YFN2_9FUNG|nr:hypothetical protein K493DRAFT_300936 [Basidiobolus meristosporus CBS 931.73]|eukprot:ORX96414.1 hypothetical protein K493DRAFT_300936 [Basidiobolus meristosporus CBS 931.73]
MRGFFWRVLWALALYQAVECDIVFTSPANAIWEAGSEKLITWNDTGIRISPPIVDLALMFGANNNGQLVTGIQNNVDTRSGFYRWLIPATSAQGSDYFIRMSKGTFIVYSSYFQIQASAGLPTGIIDPMNPGNNVLPTGTPESSWNTDQNSRNNMDHFGNNTASNNRRGDNSSTGHSISLNILSLAQYLIAVSSTVVQLYIHLI